jgi:hypothetical protein
MRPSLIEEARRLDAAGDAAGAAERYAAFLLAAGPGMEIERANAARILAERFGFAPGEGE